MFDWLRDLLGPSRKRRDHVASLKAAFVAYARDNGKLRSALAEARRQRDRARISEANAKALLTRRCFELDAACARLRSSHFRDPLTGRLSPLGQHPQLNPENDQ